MNKDEVKILWGGGYFEMSDSALTYNHSSGDIKTMLCSGDSDDYSVDITKKNYSDADAYIAQISGETWVTHIFKSDCSSTMKCKYLPGSTKLFSNNANIWYASFDNDNFVIATDYDKYKNSGTTNSIRLPFNDIETSGYITGLSSGLTAEYGFTQNAYKSDSANTTNVSMFSGCTGLTSCEVPCQMNIINNYTFYGCTNLKSYTRNPNFITNIKEYAFSGCTSLDEILIPKYSNIGTSSFANCTNAKTIRWHGVSGTSDTKYIMSQIPDYAFYGCTSLSGTVFDSGSTESIYIPTQIGKIGKYAFANDTNIRSFSANGVTAIDVNAFSGCTSLTSVTINSAETIGESAFINCNSLPSITVNNATSIGKHAFSGCTSLTSVTANKVAELSADTFYYCPNLSTVEAKKVSNVYDYAFRNCSGLTDVNIGSEYIGGAVSISSNAFSGCNNLSSVTLSKSSTGTNISSYAFANKTKLKTVNTIINSLGEAAFSGCTSLSGLTFQTNSISDSACTNCTNLSSVTFNKTEITIGKYAFAKNSSLKGINWSSISTLNEGSFKQCVKLNSISGLGSNDKRIEIPKECFYGSGIEYVVNSHIGNIGDWAFSECPNLKSVVMSSVPIFTATTSIGKSAFYGCSSLSSITFSKYVNLINKDAFRYCSSLSSMAFNTTEPPSAATDAFVFVSSGGSMTVPTASEGVYRDWKNRDNYLSGWTVNNRI